MAIYAIGNENPSLKQLLRCGNAVVILRSQFSMCRPLRPAREREADEVDRAGLKSRMGVMAKAGLALL